MSKASFTSRDRRMSLQNVAFHDAIKGGSTYELRTDQTDREHDACTSKKYHIGNSDELLEGRVGL